MKSTKRRGKVSQPKKSSRFGRHIQKLATAGNVNPNPTGGGKTTSASGSKEGGGGGGATSIIGELWNMADKIGAAGKADYDTGNRNKDGEIKDEGKYMTGSIIGAVLDPAAFLTDGLSTGNWFWNEASRARKEGVKIRNKRELDVASEANRAGALANNERLANISQGLKKGGKVKRKVTGGKVEGDEDIKKLPSYRVLKLSSDSLRTASSGLVRAKKKNSAIVRTPQQAITTVKKSDVSTPVKKKPLVHTVQKKKEDSKPIESNNSTRKIGIETVLVKADTTSNKPPVPPSPPKKSTPPPVKGFHPPTPPPKTPEQIRNFADVLYRKTRHLRRNAKSNGSKAGKDSREGCLNPSNDGYSGVAPSGSTGSVLKRADGGVVTGKSGIDTNYREVKGNSFVIPKGSVTPEVRKIARQLGLLRALPGKSGAVPVKLTKGEIVIPPQKTKPFDSLLRVRGHKGLSSLAPNAEDNSFGKVQGGYMEDEDPNPNETPSTTKNEWESRRYQRLRKRYKKYEDKGTEQMKAGFEDFPAAFNKDDPRHEEAYKRTIKNDALTKRYNDKSQKLFDKSLVQSTKDINKYLDEKVKKVSAKSKPTKLTFDETITDPVKEGKIKTRAEFKYGSKSLRKNADGSDITIDTPKGFGVSTSAKEVQAKNKSGLNDVINRTGKYNGTNPGEKTPKTKSQNYGMETGLSALQGIIGAAGAAGMGKAPVLTMDDPVEFQTIQTREALRLLKLQGTYGIDPRSKVAMEESINSTFRNSMAMSKELSGSPAETFNRATASGMMKLKADIDLGSRDAEMRNAKEGKYADALISTEPFIASEKARYQDEKTKRTLMKQGLWDKESDAYAGLMNAGLSNAFNASRTNKFWNQYSQVSNPYMT